MWASRAARDSPGSPQQRHRLYFVICKSEYDLNISFHSLNNAEISGAAIPESIKC